MKTTAKLLEIEEGFSSKPYYCSEGYPTIGIGDRIGPKGANLDLYEFSLSREVAEAWLEDGLYNIHVNLISLFDWYSSLCQPRKDILISMCYQLGLTGFLKFKKTIEHLESGNFRDASIEMLDSKWAKQTPERAMRHSQVMCFGNYNVDSYYKDIL